MIDLRGKTLLVTGASSGIGAATVRQLHGAGATVVAHYANGERQAEALAASLGGERVYLVRADFAERHGAAQLWADAIAKVGSIDGVVNNAAIMEPVPLDAPWDVWHAAWDLLLRVDLVAVADICREAIGHFRVLGGGVIVNVASRAAFRGDTLEYMHYAAAKAGIIALTRSVARGCGRDGTVAYAVAPGFVDTPMVEDFVKEYGHEAITRDIPLGEMVPPTEVANVIAFLVSGLARHATGTTVDINGASYVR